MAIAVHSTQAAEQPTAATSSADKPPTTVWNRTGPLGETPKHVTDTFLLSDQKNQDGWVKFEPMTDEFEGQDLDLNKWSRGMSWWKRRQPALFSEKNVTVSDGKSHSYGRLSGRFSACAMVNPPRNTAYWTSRNRPSPGGSVRG